MFFQILLAIVFNYGFTKCPITLQQMPSSMSCLYGLTCFTYQNTQIMVYQNCNMKWYLARNSTTTGGQYTHQPLPSMSSINRKVNSIKMNHQFMIVDYGNYLLYYNFGSGMPNYFTLNCTILNIDVLNPNHSKLQAIVICQSQVARLLFGNLYMSIQDYYQINYSLSTLKCMSNSSICLIGTQNGQLLYYNYDINKVQFLLNLPQNISVTKIVYKANINKTKAYVSCTNGRIYELIIQKDRFTIERQCIKFVNENIHELTVSLDGNYLIVSDKRANLTQLSTNSGILLDNINLDIYMQNKSSLTLNSVFINQSTYVIFNPLNKLMLAASVTPQNILNQYYLICFSMKYYNLSLQECKACSSNCSACNPVNGSCSDCAEGYFNKQGQCLSCFYEVQGLTTYFKECFSVSQKMIMDSSSSVVNFLSYSVSSFSNFLNILGILFIFMKVINNWNIISLYLFLPLDNIPFFLYNMLMTIYTNFNGSVLSYFKIQIDFAFNVKNGFQNNDKYLFTSKTTDFMKQNGENIILFIYSIILILTLFRFINYIFSRYNYQIFQHNHYFAILDQFIGTFTTSLVPFFSIVKLKCSTPMDKFNSFCFYNLMGLAIIAPFLILIVTQEKPKARRKNKVANLDDIAAIELIQKQKFKRKVKLINYDTSRQSFLYAILSFSIAILAPYENPIPFFIFISIIHILSIANILYSKNIPVNNLIQKINGFLFHIGFILFYILDDRHVQFYLSLAIVFIIIFGTVHEIIAGIFIKIQLIWLIIQAKIEKDKKIKQFLQSEKNKNKNKNREHPKEIKMPITSPQLAQVKNKKSKNVSFDNKAHICHQKSFVFSKNKIVPIKNVNFGQTQFENQFQPNFGFKTDNKLNNIYEKPKIKIRKQRGESVDKK